MGRKMPAQAKANFLCYESQKKSLEYPCKCQWPSVQYSHDNLE